MGPQLHIAIQARIEHLNPETMNAVHVNIQPAEETIFSISNSVTGDSNKIYLLPCKYLGLAPDCQYRSLRR